MFGFYKTYAFKQRKRPARHPDRPFRIFLLRCGIRRRIVQVVGDELQLILEHQLQVCHGVHHVGGRIVYFQQLAQVQTVQFHGGVHLPAFGAQDVAQGIFLQSDALHKVNRPPAPASPWACRGRGSGVSIQFSADMIKPSFRSSGQGRCTPHSMSAGYAVLLLLFRVLVPRTFSMVSR